MLRNTSINAMLSLSGLCPVPELLYSAHERALEKDREKHHNVCKARFKLGTLLIAVQPNLLACTGK
jgi:hypothetical protein